MSGGSWDYMFGKMDEAGARLFGSSNYLRRALGRRMVKMAKAMHDIEWVDSGDYSPGDDTKAIQQALGKDAKALELYEVVEAGRKVLVELQTALEKVKP